MILRETGGSVAAVGSGQIVAAVVVVHQAGEVTLHVIGGRLAGRIRIHFQDLSQLGGVVDTEVLAGHSHVFVLVVVVLMTEQRTDFVQAERLVVIQELLRVVGVGPGGTLGQVAVVGTGGVVVHEGAVGIGVPAVVVIGTAVDREYQAVHQLEIGEAAHGKGVAVGTGRSVLVAEDRVAAGAARPVEPIGLGEVIPRLAPAVDEDVAVAVTQPHRIHRRLRLDGLPDESGVQGTFRSIVILILRIVEITAHLEPGLGLVVGGEAGRQTVLVGPLLDTLLVQITEGSEIVQLAGDGTGHGDVVLLAETVPETFLLPVVRLEPEGLAVIDMEGAEGSLRVHRAALKDEILSARDGINHVTGAGRGTLDITVRLGMGVGGGSAVQDRLVVDSLIVGLVELLRIRSVVQLQGVRVHAPLGIERDLRVTGLAALGGDHDHTVRAAGTVQRVGSGIFEDGHRLDIGGVDEVQVTVVRHAVHDNKRGRIGGIGTDTADGDGRGTAQLAGGVVDLDTGHAACQGLGSVGDLCLGQLFGLHHARRTGEGLAFHLTEGDDHDVVQHFCVLLEDDGKTGLSVYRNLLGHIAHTGDIQRCVGRHADDESTVQVGNDAVGRGSGLKDSCSDDGNAGRVLDHAVHRRLSPGSHTGGQEQDRD